MLLLDPGPALGTLDQRRLETSLARKLVLEHGVDQRAVHLWNVERRGRLGVYHKLTEAVAAVEARCCACLTGGRNKDGRPR